VRGALVYGLAHVSVSLKFFPGSVPSIADRMLHWQKGFSFGKRPFAVFRSVLRPLRRGSLRVEVPSKGRRSVCADQSAGFLCGQATGGWGADVALEAADGRTGQRAKDAIGLALVVAQPAQRLLHADPVRFGHACLIGHGRHCRR
jgi:hypothetical protein